MMTTDLILEKLKIAAIARADHACLKDAAYDVSEHVDFLSDQLTFRMVAYVTAQNLGTEEVTLCVSYPADWWQHIKQRWFPRWALDRWPIAMETKRKVVELKQYVLYPDYVLPGQRLYCTVIPHGPFEA